MITIEKFQVNGIYGILNPIQLNKITNPVIRKTILKLVLELQKLSEESKTSIEETRKKLFENFSQEDIMSFQEKVNEIERCVASKDSAHANEIENEVKTNYGELYTAYTDFISYINESATEKVDLPIEPVEMNDFVDALVGLDVNITAKELNTLKPIFKNESAE